MDGKLSIAHSAHAFHCFKCFKDRSKLGINVGLLYVAGSIFVDTIQ